MNVGIDARPASGKRTGIGYYTRNLIRALDGKGGLRYTCFTGDRNNDLNTPERIYWENIRLPWLVRRSKVDLLHIPGFAGPLFKCGRRKVTTVHDLIGMIYPRNLDFASRFYWQKWLPACIGSSDAVIADSENTRTDILRLLRVPESRVHVVPLAVEEKFSPGAGTGRFETVRAKYGLPAEFMLTVGTVEPRKNVHGLIAAAALYFRERDTGLHVVVVGSKDWGYDQAGRKMEELGIRDRVRFTGYIEEEDMPVVYNMAKFFVYPSFYEGFGLPVLEALSCGIPVICSGVSSLPEVAGDAAILIDPGNVTELKEAVRSLDEDPRLLSAMSRRALRQAGKFSWQSTAERTLEVYKKLL